MSFGLRSPLTHYDALSGRPSPLGATWDGEGVNFALASETAEAIDLCLFDEGYGAPEAARVPLRARTGSTWHTYLPGLGPGAMYGYRVYGPHAPNQGLLFNPNKLLLDPYAHATTGAIQWSEALRGARRRDSGLEMDPLDSGPVATKSVVASTEFRWGDDRPLRTPWKDTVILEAHVKGFTRLCPELPEEMRGTYAALGHPRVIDYLQRLGVTAVELLPVYQFIDDEHLVRRRLRNYWGYGPLGFFAPEPRYALTADPNERLQEFKNMVRALHQAGLEVILDVVYNHTGEGSRRGPTICYRGIDNPAYYRLAGDDPNRYVDYTGCGNTLNMLHPQTLALVMDSLRYWVAEMHVDGFRFDLAPVLGRGEHEVEMEGPFFQAMEQDVVLSQVKVIAEPWDLGEGGNQSGRFPLGWAEWNGSYRDTIRRFWRGESGLGDEVRRRITGSSDIFGSNGRSIYASINYLTAHDGFTLRDLVTYEGKRNEANGEDNRDGTNEHWSWNCGAEGDTEDEEVRTLRARQMRNFLTTLFISWGVPMLLQGDEVGHSQRGNNNAYCQDNEISWRPWEIGAEGQEMLSWLERLARLRRRHPVLTPESGDPSGPAPAWFLPDGHWVGSGEWAEGPLGLLLAAERDALVVLVNPRPDPVDFRLPDEGWELALDTARPEATERGESYPGGAAYTLAPRAMAVLQRAQADFALLSG